MARSLRRLTVGLLGMLIAAGGCSYGRDTSTARPVPQSGYATPDPVLEFLETDRRWMGRSMFAARPRSYCAYEKYGESATQIFIVAYCTTGTSAYVVPAALTAERGTAGLTITDFAVAQDGSEFAPSIRRMFPGKVASKVLHEYGHNPDLIARGDQRAAAAGIVTAPP